jgi:Domain of unknown function (DUF4365)
MSLTIQNIESELSYAYLHAVASRAGINCQVLNRHSDNDGVDAQLEYQAPIPGAYISDVIIKVQLKATKLTPLETTTHYSYFFGGKAQYDDMRQARRGSVIKILVVMFLADDSKDWVLCSQSELQLKRACYWVSLQGAKETDNANGKTIYIPKKQLLTPDSLVQLFHDAAKLNPPTYQNPKP